MKSYLFPILASLTCSALQASTTSILCYNVHRNYQTKTYQKSLPYFLAQTPTHHGLYPLAQGHTLTTGGYYYVASSKQGQDLINLCGPNTTEIKVNGSGLKTRSGYPIIFKTNMNNYMRLRGEAPLNIENSVSSEKLPTIDFDKVMRAATFAKGVYDRDFKALSDHEGVDKVTPLYREIGNNDLGAAIVQTTNNQLWIVFRGTDSAEDWTKGNLRSENLNASILGDRYHKGFYEMSRQHRQEVMEYIKENTSNHYGKPLIHITGHSLGGGQAIVMAQFLMLQGYPIDLTTFAAPIPTDIQGAINIEALRQGTNSSILRIYHSDDIVPTVGINTGNWMKPLSFANSTNGFGYGLNLGNRTNGYNPLTLAPHFMKNYIDTLNRYKNQIKFNEAFDMFTIKGISQGIDKDKALVVREIIKKNIDLKQVYNQIKYNHVPQKEDLLSKSLIVIDGKYYHDHGATEVNPEHYKNEDVEIMRPLTSEEEIDSYIHEFQFID